MQSVRRRKFAALEISDLRPLPQHVSNDIGAVNLPSADAGPLSDALLRTLRQLPYGTWTLALAERGLPVETALRNIRLRRTYPQKRRLLIRVASWGISRLVCKNGMR